MMSRKAGSVRLKAFLFAWSAPSAAHLCDSDVTSLSACIYLPICRAAIV